jgi:hypothetical protein
MIPTRSWCTTRRCAGTAGGHWPVARSPRSAAVRSSTSRPWRSR